MTATEEATSKWREFALKVLNHIKEKGDIYDREGTVVLDMVSNNFCIDSILKYTIECKSHIEKGLVPPKGSLMSIAHYAQILTTRYYNAPITVKTK